MRKIEEAYICKLNKKISINELIELRHNNIELLDCLKNELLCPICKEAKLSFIFRKSTPYLKTKNGEKHQKNCILNQPVMTENERKNFIDTAKPITIIKQLEKINNLLLGNKSSKQSIGDSSEQHYQRSNKKIIPHKRIDYCLDNDDLDTIKYFYGKVNIRWSYDNSKNNYWLNVLSVNNKINYCNIKITANVYLHLDRLYLQEYNNINFVYLGKIKKYNNKNYSTALKSYCLFFDI